MRGVTNELLCEYSFDRTLWLWRLKDIFCCIYWLQTMQKCHHGNILFVNLDLRLLEGIKVVGRMTGKSENQNPNQAKPKQNISVLEMCLRETIW